MLPSPTMCIERLNVMLNHVFLIVGGRDRLPLVNASSSSACSHYTYTSGTSNDEIPGNLGSEREARPPALGLREPKLLLAGVEQFTWSHGAAVSQMILPAFGLGGDDEKRTLTPLQAISPAEARVATRNSPSSIRLVLHLHTTEMCTRYPPLTCIRLSRRIPSSALTLATIPGRFLAAFIGLSSFILKSRLNREFAKCLPGSHDHR